MNLIRVYFSVLFLITGSTFANVPQVINYQGKISAEGSPFDGNGQFKFALVSGPQGPGALATGEASVNYGFLTGITVTSGGSGYLSAPTVSIVDESGTGASATAILSGGSVSSITVTNAGFGYSESPTVLISTQAAPDTYTTYWSNDASSVVGSEPSGAVGITVDEGIFSVLLGDASLANMNVILPSVFENENVFLRIWFDDGFNGFEQLTPDQRIAAVGYAMMAESVPDGSIDSQALASAAVTSDKIALGAVGSAELANDAVSASNIASGSITGDKLEDGAITSDKIELSVLSTVGNVKGDVYLGPWVVAGNRQYNVVMDMPIPAFTDPNSGMGVSVTYINNKVHVLAGSTPDRIERVYIYDTSSRSWSDGSALSVSRKGAASLVLGHKIYVFGGEDSSSLGTFPREVELYDASTETWSVVGMLPASAPRKGLCVEELNGQIYLVGGENGSGKTSRLDAYNISLNSWTTKAPLPVAASYSGSAKFNGHLGVVGGDSGSSLLDSGYYYDPTNNTWTALTAQASESEPRQRPKVIAIEDGSTGIDGVYIVGGINNAYQRSIAVDYFRPGYGLYAIPINTQNATIYYGTGFDDNVFLWGDGLYEIQIDDLGHLEKGNPYLARKYGYTAHWRNKLNCTVEHLLGPGYSLALLNNFIAPERPKFNVQKWASVSYVSGNTAPYSGTITKWYVYNLPSGLSYNSSTGAITGTPSSSSGSAAISILGIGPGGTASTALTINW